MKFINKSTFDILLLILVSFSPLISINIKVGIVILYFLFNYKHLNINSKSNFIWLICIMSLLLFGIILDTRNVENVSDLSLLNFYIPLTFLIGYTVAHKYSINIILFEIDKVVYILAILSLIGVFVYTFIPSIINNLPSYTYYNTTHKTAIFFNILISEIGVVRRNAGIAWEPGAFQFLLNLGIYSYIKMNQRLHLMKLGIYILALASTVSTMGYIIFLIISLSIFKRHKIIGIAYIFLIFISWDQLYSILEYQMDYKLLGSFAFESRFEPMINAYKIGFDNFWGIGSTGYNNMLNFFNIGSYDSFSQILMRYGFPLFLSILILLIRLAGVDKWIFIIIFLTFFSQTIWFLPFTTIFYFFNKDKAQNISS